MQVAHGVKAGNTWAGIKRVARFGWNGVCGLPWG